MSICQCYPAFYYVYVHVHTHVHMGACTACVEVREQFGCWLSSYYLISLCDISETGPSLISSDYYVDCLVFMFSWKCLHFTHMKVKVAQKTELRLDPTSSEVTRRSAMGCCPQEAAVPPLRQASLGTMAIVEYRNLLGLGQLIIPPSYDTLLKGRWAEYSSEGPTILLRFSSVFSLGNLTNKSSFMR